MSRHLYNKQSERSQRLGSDPLTLGLRKAHHGQHGRCNIAKGTRFGPVLALLIVHDEPVSLSCQDKRNLVRGVCAMGCNTPVCPTMSGGAKLHMTFVFSAKSPADESS